jgi:GGDEF domain-containing protein
MGIVINLGDKMTQIELITKANKDMKKKKKSGGNSVCFFNEA